jgi:hypothetical protein
MRKTEPKPGQAARPAGGGSRRAGPVCARPGGRLAAESLLPAVVLLALTVLVAAVAMALPRSEVPAESLAQAPHAASGREEGNDGPEHQSQLDVAESVAPRQAPTHSDTDHPASQAQPLFTAPEPAADVLPLPASAPAEPAPAVFAPTGIDLRADAASPSLRNEAAAEPPFPPSTPRASASEPAAPLDPVAVPPPATGELGLPPGLPNVRTHENSSGDAHMRTTWRALSLPAFLAAWLAAGPAPADDSKKDAPPTLSDISVQLKAIEKSVGDVDRLRTVPTDLTQVKTDLDTLKADVARLTATLERIDKAVAKLDRMAEEMRVLKDNRENASFDEKVTLPSLMNEIRDLKKQIALVQKDLDGARRSSTSQRIAGAPPIPNAPVTNAPVAGTTGTIRLRNSWLEPMSIVVNGQTYLVNPGQDINLTQQPPGAFTYEVPRIGRRATVILNPNETFGITVQPQ